MNPLRVRSPLNSSSESKSPQSSTRGPVPVLNRSAWAARAFYFDIFALTVLLLTALLAGLDLYSAGYTSAWSGARPENPSFRLVVRLGFALIGFAASFAWLSARLLRAGYRELPGAPR